MLHASGKHESASRAIMRRACFQMQTVAIIMTKTDEQAEMTVYACRSLVPAGVGNAVPGTSLYAARGTFAMLAGNTLNLFLSGKPQGGLCDSGERSKLFCSALAPRLSQQQPRKMGGSGVYNSNSPDCYLSEAQVSTARRQVQPGSTEPAPCCQTIIFATVVGALDLGSPVISTASELANSILTLTGAAVI
jgi:hypothetical protein